MAYIISRPWGGHCGIGHQFHNWVVAWQLAKHYGLKFVHSPFCGDILEPQIDVPVKEWEEFLGFGVGEIQESQLPDGIQRYALPELPWKQDLWLGHTCDNPTWQQAIEGRKDDHVLFECVRNQFMRLDPSCLQYDILRDRYWQARQQYPVRCLFDSTQLNVAIHIRRGDVSSNSSAKDRWADIQIYVNVINQIAEHYRHPVMFHIYSDGTKENLRPVTNLPNTVLHLRDNVFDTFHHMVLADVLVVGKSSFSALAGYLQPKIQIVQTLDSIPDRPQSLKRSVGSFTWEHLPDQEHFVPMDGAGQFSVNRLLSQLRKEGFVC